MRMSFGLIQVTIPFTYLRGKTVIYQRAVPTDLLARYKGKTIKHDLKASDLTLVARKVEKLNQRYAAEWDGLRSDPACSPKSLRVHADALLRAFGLAPNSPNNHPAAEDIFFDRLQAKLEAFAKDDREVY